MTYQQRRLMLYMGMAGAVFCAILSIYFLGKAFALYAQANCPRPVATMTYTIPFKGTLP